MSKMSNVFNINDDEFKFLSEMVQDAKVEKKSNSIEFDLIGDNEQTTLLSQLKLADNLQITANFGRHRLVFPVQLKQGDFANFSMVLQSPKIFEQGDCLRSWRLLADNDICLTDKGGKILNYHVKDISASGISLLIDNEEHADFPEHLNNIYLQLPNNERLAISATQIRRIDDKTVAYMLRSSLDDTVLTSLIKYLFECHSRQFPDVYKNKKNWTII
ncbi:MAG: PilZ domain-containing protein [Psychromonas sp.]